MTKKTGLWAEDYRPKKVADCILPARIKKPLTEIVSSGEIPNLLFEGGPGCGKTTVAKAIADEMGLQWILINGSEENGIDVLRTKIRNFASQISVADPTGIKIVILDEADNLSDSMQKGLRSFIEEFAATTRFFFTCNYKNRLLPALHSRWGEISFKFSNEELEEMLPQFFTRIQEILKDNGVVFDRLALAGLIKKHRSDFRKIINELQRYAKNGEINSGILSAPTAGKISALVEFMKAKKFKDIRQFVAENSELTGPEFFDSFYANLSTYLAPGSIPTAVLTIAEYQYKAAFVVNQEINIVACIVELMSQCEFK